MLPGVGGCELLVVDHPALEESRMCVCEGVCVCIGVGGLGPIQGTARRMCDISLEKAAGNSAPLGILEDTPDGLYGRP